MPSPRRAQSGKSDKDKGRTEAPTEGGDLKFDLLGKSVIQSLPIGVISFDSDLRIIEANSKAIKLIELGDYIDKSLAKGMDSSYTQRLGWTKELKATMSTGKRQSFDSIGYTSNGKTRLLRIVCIPLVTVEGQRILGGTVLIEDITEKVNLQKELANAERLATVGQLASKVAHELNDPLDGILRYINLAARIIEQEDLEKPKEYLARCREGLMRMVQIVSELLEFSRGMHTSAEYVKAEQIIEDAIKAMEAKAEISNVRLLRNYAGEGPQVRGGNLFQVFCNLIKNAFDAMPDGGELHVSTRVESDDTVVVEFRDTGKGFAAENAEVIFEPFFTTKDKGTGLGLTICRDIIERYHGRITAENAPEGGSIFTVYLPLAGNP